MTTENRVKLLWDCANSLSAETHTNKLLKSYYIHTCRKLARDNIQVPKEKFAVSQMCPRCSVFWSENEFSLKLKPQAVAKSGKAKKLIAKLDDALATQKKGVLSKKQRRRAKWLKKRVRSTVEIRCNNCQHKSQVTLQKPQKKQNIEVNKVAETTIEAAPLAQSKKKKSKKKDPTAGLKIKPTKPKQPTASIAAKSKTHVKEAANVDVKQKKVDQESISSIKAKVKAKVNPTQAVAVKHSPNLSQPLKAKKKKKYNNNNNKTTPHEPTVISKTQKKNSLLQLAALLKSQGSKSNTQQNRLDSLLE